MKKRLSEVAIKRLGFEVPKDKLKEAAELYLEKKGLNMPGLHEWESSDEGSKSSRSSCECEHVHDPLNCASLPGKGKAGWRKRMDT